MTTAEALDLYSKSETSRYELARMVLAGHRLRREVLTLQAEVARLTGLLLTAELQREGLAPKGEPR